MSAEACAFEHECFMAKCRLDYPVPETGKHPTKDDFHPHLTGQPWTPSCRQKCHCGQKGSGRTRCKIPQLEERTCVHTFGHRMIGTTPIVTRTEKSPSTIDSTAACTDMLPMLSVLHCGATFARGNRVEQTVNERLVEDF